MRHRNSGRKLSRTPAHRKALFRNMAKALLTCGRITTTEAKAKEIRGVVEPLITLGLKNDLHARREAYRVLGCHGLVKYLFDEIAPVYAGTPGGFTRVLKLSMPRKGDNAPLAIIELTKKAEIAPKAKEKPAKVPFKARPKAEKSGDAAAKDGKNSAAKPAKQRAAKFATPKAPKASPKSAAPKMMKIGGE